MSKYEAVAKSETQSTFNSDCLIIFARRKVPPTVNGKTIKEESSIVCFAKTNIAAIKKSFEDLLNKKYTEAVLKENDQFKIQSVPANFNMAVKYFTPFMLTQKVPPTDLQVFFSDLNENGISYNTENVSYLHINSLSLYSLQILKLSHTLLDTLN